MDIQMQTPVSTVSTGNAGAAATGTVNGSDSAKAAAAGDFSAALQTVMQQNEQEATKESSILASLFQGISPALLVMLLPQTQNADGTAGIVVEGADAAQLLEAISAHPELLANLANSQAGQQWFAQAGQLLASMGKTVPAADASGVTHAQLQNFMDAFVTALNEEPDSVLLRQLADSFLNLGKPADKNQPVDKTAADSKVSPLPNANASSTKPVDSGADSVKPLKDVQDSRLISFRVGAKIDPASQLNAMAAKGAMAYQLAVGGNVDGSERSLINATVEQSVSERLPLPSQLNAMAAKGAMAYQWAVGGNVNGSEPSLLNATVEQSVLESLSLTSKLNADSQSGGKNENAGQNAASSFPFSDLLKTASGQNTNLNQAFPKPVSAQTFIQDMSQFVMKSFKANPFTGTSEARLILTPDNLGQVDVKISMNNGQVVAQFAAHTMAGKEMLESQLSMLRQNLQQQGLQVDRLEVTQNSSLQSGMFQEQRQQQQSFQQSGKQYRNVFNAAETVQDDFSKEVAGLMSELDTESGGSIDYTA